MELNAILQNIPHHIVQSGTTSNIQHITRDTRAVIPGTLFICLRGINTNWHHYISQVAQSGAVAVLVEELSETYPPNLTVIKVENTRHAMAHIAANYYQRPAEKLKLIGITGTNGKTTTTHFVEEILRTLGYQTGVIGTTGIKANNTPLDIPFATSTTPDPLELHAIFAKMVDLGVQYVVMEVTSHALALHKMVGLTFCVGIFTNLTQDHLDFHGTMENYANAKGQLFAQSQFAVVNKDDQYTPLMLTHHGDAPYTTYSIHALSNIHAQDIQYHPSSSCFTLDNQSWTIPVTGKFNVYNILAAIGTARHVGAADKDISQAVATISGVPGRIQAVPNHLGVQIFVDYAHTPDGLTNIISSVREVTPGRIITIFGCGGDRDATKRPIMGEIAATLSDHCIITSDNPRTEDPMAIIAQAEAGLANIPTPYEICENRRDAIFRGVNMLKGGDTLIIAGKGHEDYQEIGTTKYPFSDYDTADEAVRHATSTAPSGMNLTMEEISAAVQGTVLHPVPTPPITAVATDTRPNPRYGAVTPGALFVPLSGAAFDGHNYINAAAAQGAVCALAEREVPSDIPLILVQSVPHALMALAAYYRRKCNVKVVAVTGSAGKTTTKDMIYHVLAQRYKTKKTIGNLNNNIGVPLSIFQLEADDEVLVLEMGMNHAGEIHELSLVGAPDITVITHIGDAHIENFPNREGILHAKLEIVDGQKPTGTVVLNGDDPLLTGPLAVPKISGFTVHFPSSQNIVKADTIGLAKSICHFHWQGQDIHLTVPLPGRHMVMNALLTTAVGMELGLTPQEITKGFEAFTPPGGRLTIESHNEMTIINDAYNANPAAMVESIKILCSQPTRKVAILGDMNELGHVAETRHKEIGDYTGHMGIDLLVAIGPLAKHIYESSTLANKHYFATVDDCLPTLHELITPGDTILVKASRGMAFEKIVEALL